MSEKCPLLVSVLARASIKPGSGALQARVNSHATEDASFALGGVRACAGKYQARLRGTAGASQLARHGGSYFFPLLASVLARASIKLGSGALRALVNSHATEDTTFYQLAVDRRQRA